MISFQSTISGLRTAVSCSRSALQAITRPIADSLDRREEAPWLPRGAQLASGANYLPRASAESERRELEPRYGFALQAPFEQPAKDEALWVRRATELVRSRVEELTRSARAGDPAAQARRGAHAKHHGLLEATLRIRRDLPSELQHGIFVPGRAHRALVRVSNMSEKVQPDTKSDARGLAIKVLNVDDYGEACPGGVPEPDEQYGATQDFNLASHPTFFVKDVRDYTILRSILAERDKLELLARLALFLARRPREAWILWRSTRRTAEHVLDVDYHSMTAYALGPELAVKYCLERAKLPRRVRAPRGVDYLRERLRSSLDPATGETLRMELCLIVPEPGRPISVEDPRIDWRMHGARRVPVATLEIAPQDPCTRARMELAETLELNPWHTRKEHRPLGNLSRARLFAYRASSAHRRAANAQPASQQIAAE